MRRTVYFIFSVIMLISFSVPCFAFEEEYVNELDSNVIYDNQYIVPQKKLMLKSVSSVQSVNNNITVDENYLNFDNLESYNISSSSVLSSAYDYINQYVNVENSKIYLYPTLRQVDGRFGSAFLLVGSVNEMSIDDTHQVGSFNANTNYNSDYTLSNIYRSDNTTVEYSIYTGYYRSSTSRWLGSTSAVSFPNNTYYVDFTKFDSSYFLVFDNGNCVSEKFCSPEYLYVDSSGDDYEEGNVHITGLVGFFNRMTAAMNSIVQSLTNMVRDIIGIPQEGYFAEKVNTLKTTINQKYNLDSLFGFISDLQNLQSAEPDLSYNNNLNINNTSIPFNFSVSFAWFDGSIKNSLFMLVRAVGYPMLIIYNLNQFYLLFRGRKFFDNGGEDK